MPSTTTTTRYICISLDYTFIRNYYDVIPISVSDSSVLSTPTLSVRSTCSSEEGPSNSSGSNNSLSDVTHSSCSVAQAADEASVVTEEESEQPFTISTGIFSRPKLTLKPEEFQLFLKKKWPPARFDLYLKANFPSLFTVKKDFLDKIPSAAKKTKSNEVDVRFEDISDHVPFLPTTLRPLLDEIMNGLRDMRRERIEKSPVKKKDNCHRIGYLSFIQIVWQGLGNYNLGIKLN
jgi:hypothetical protein